MANRGNWPVEPQDIKGGVRGTHGLGDAPRERDQRSVAAQGGTASPTGGSRKGGSASATHVDAARADAVTDAAEHDEATGEEHGFEHASAIGDLESEKERARRRERDARAAQEDLAAREAAKASEASAEEVLGDPRTDREERRDRGLATERTPGPGPKDTHAGRARVQHLEDHGLKR